jgi:hypothetical protein
VNYVTSRIQVWLGCAEIVHQRKEGGLPFGHHRHANLLIASRDAMPKQVRRQLLAALQMVSE